MAKLRKLGDILLDMEPLINEAMDHNLQYGDFLALMYQYLLIHRPDDQEVYLDDTNPEFYYGPKPRRKNV